MTISLVGRLHIAIADSYCAQSQDAYKVQPAWGFEHELLSAGSMASSGADGCVPELMHGSLSHVIIKSEACVPDYNTSRDGSPCMPAIQVQPVYPLRIP